MGRPKIDSDGAEVKKLASFGCNNSEIAELLGVTEGTIRKRFSDNLTKGRSSLKKSLRRKQIEIALSGNVTMLIWLGKNMLGQTDKQEITGDEEKPVTVKIIRASVADSHQ